MMSFVCHVYDNACGEIFGIYICQGCYSNLQRIVSHGIMTKFISLSLYLGQPTKSHYIISDKLYIHNYYEYSDVRESCEIELYTGFEYLTANIRDQDCCYCRINNLCAKCFQIKIYILWLDIKDCLVNIAELNQDINSYIQKILLNNC